MTCPTIFQHILPFGRGMFRAQGNGDGTRGPNTKQTRHEIDMVGTEESDPVGATAHASMVKQRAGLDRLLL